MGSLLTFFGNVLDPNKAGTDLELYLGAFVT
jgi:hypothetical protein